MNTKLKFIARLFLIGFVLFGQGCAEEDFPLDGLPSFRETDNWAADRLQRQLQEQSAAYDKLLHSLPGGKPLYPHVRLITMPDYGLCYFIPYGDTRVEGAVFYPLDSELREDGTYLLDCALKDPDCIDARRLNEDIPITRRFLYSVHFKELQSQGVEVNPALVACADELSGNFVYISQEESSFGVETRASSGLVYVALRFSGLSYGDVNSEGEAVVHGLALSTLKSLVTSNLQKMNVHTIVLPEYHSPGEMRFSLPISELTSTPRAFFDTFISLLENDLRSMGYPTRVQYETFYNDPWESSGNTGSSGTGGGGGGGGSTSTTPSSFSNPVVDNSQSSKDIQTAAGKLWENLSSIKDTTIWGNHYISFQDYLEEVKKDTTREHATFMVHYKEDDCRPILTETVHGSENKVTQTFSSRCIIAQVHNHPNGTPPSAQDLFFTTDALDCEKDYQATFAYNHKDESYYSLYVYDSNAAKGILNSLREEIDAETNDFVAKGKCRKLLEDNKKTYQKMSLEMQQIYRLCIVIAEYGGGIAVTKYNLKTKKNNVYQVKKGKDSKGKDIYIPLICE